MDASLKIPCTLIPTSKHHLLLPNSGITEVLLCTALNNSNTASAPSWLLGSINWQNQPVYIIDFDKIDDGDLDKKAINLKKAALKNKKTKKMTIVVIRNTEENTPTNAVFGILALSVPQVIEANSLNIDKNAHPKHLHSHAKSYVEIQQKEAIIPDVALLTQRIHEISELKV